MAQASQTYCRICEAACGLLVERDHNGTPLRLVPDREHSISKGFVCAKGTRFLEVSKHPARLTSPMERRNGKLEKITWEKAYDGIAKRLRPILDQYGPQALGIYFGNPLAFNVKGIATMFATMKALGTYNVFAAGSQDCNNKFAAGRILHGSAVIHPLPDLEHARRAFFFGTNPAISQSSFIHLEGGGKSLDAFVQRGGQLTFVDVRHTESAKRWGRSVVIRPGTDVYLLLYLFRACDKGTQYQGIAGLDRLRRMAKTFTAKRTARLTGIDETELHALSEQLQDGHPTAFHMSVGVNQGPFGTLSYIALQALALVTGSLDVRGGVVFHPLAPWLARFADLVGMDGPAPPSRIGQFPSVMGTYPGGILAEEITTGGPGQIKALLCIAGDPLRSIPGSNRLKAALPQLNTIVSIDLFENETGRYADFLLPTPSWLERWDVATTTSVFQTSPLLQWGSPIQDAPPDTRPEEHILFELCQRLERPLLGNKHLARLWRMASNDRLLSGMSRLTQRLLRPLYRKTAHTRGFPSPRPKPGSYLGKQTRHPQGQMWFWHPSLDAEEARLHCHAASVETNLTSEANEDGQPMRLLCRRRKIAHNSWLHGGKRDGKPEACAWLSPEDHTALQDNTDAEATLYVEITSKEHAIQIAAVPQKGVATGTIVLPHGLPSTQNDHNVNALIPSGINAIEPISGQHLMTGIQVHVKRRTTG